MASSLSLFASNLVTRSFRPTVVSASTRFLSIEAGHRSYSTSPKDDFHQSSVTIACPKFSKMSFWMVMTDKRRTLRLEIPKDVLSVELEKTGLKMKDIRRCGEHEHDTWFIQDIMLPDKTSTSDIKEVVTLPKEDEFESTNIILSNMANDIITSFCDMGVKHTWSYYDMFFDRSILGKGLCRLIAMRSPSNSFTIYKEETDECLEIEMCIPGEEKMELTYQGLRVSLQLGKNRPSYWGRGRSLYREDVKVFFDYDTFFIEGKTKKRHFITGIHLPEGIHMKHNMIKRKMEDGLFHVFLPCCGEMEKLNDQLKLIKERV